MNIQKSLDHPNILPLLAWFQDDKNIYLVLEHAPGGDLYAMCVFWKNTISERKVARILMQIAAALKGCDDRGITHRDVKQHNLLLNKEGDICKLADFGRSIMSAGTMDGIAGTMPYMAPEMLREPTTGAAEYTSKVDMWSLGVVAYGLFTADLPFELPEKHLDYASQLEFIEDANRDAEKDIFERCRALHVPDGAMDLLRKLLQVDPNKRISAEEVLEHPWIQHHKVSSLDEFVQHWSFLLCFAPIDSLSVRFRTLRMQLSPNKVLLVRGRKHVRELLRSFLERHHSEEAKRDMNGKSSGAGGLTQRT